jgi:hypothetical protein
LLHTTATVGTSKPSRDLPSLGTVWRTWFNMFANMFQHASNIWQKGMNMQHNWCSFCVLGPEKSDVNFGSFSLNIWNLALLWHMSGVTQCDKLRHNCDTGWQNVHRMSNRMSVQKCLKHPTLLAFDFPSLFGKIQCTLRWPGDKSRWVRQKTCNMLTHSGNMKCISMWITMWIQFFSQTRINWIILKPWHIRIITSNYMQSCPANLSWALWVWTGKSSDNLMVYYLRLSNRQVRQEPRQI